MIRAALVASALLALQASTVDAQEAESALAARLSQTAVARIESDGVAGAVIVLLRAGEPVWTGAFGMADPERGVRMTGEALFRVESLSKPVTAWGAMRLAEAGLLDLDAPAAECLRRWQPPAGTPTFTARQLLSQTAGVGLGDFTERYAPDAERPALPDHLDRDFQIIAAPGEQFAYSDTGYTLLELMMEDCTNEDFAAVITREVFTPLGMSTATYDWPGPDMPIGHDLQARPVAPYVYPARASGGAFATADDIARLAAASLAGEGQAVLSESSLATLHRPIVAVGGLFGFAADGYALGHFTETLSDGRLAVWHGGQGYGWMSHMHLVPETGDGIVILSNSQRAWPLFAAVLRDWSESLDVAPVGMTRVLLAERVAHFAIGLALAVALLALRLAYARQRSLAFRITAGIAATTLIGWPLWAAAQTYLFLFSILPGLWPWLGGASALAGLGLASLALMPERDR